MSREKLERINKAIYNAERGIDKFGADTKKGQLFKAEIEHLRKEKAGLPPEILRQEKEEIYTRQLIHVVQSNMIGRPKDLESFSQKLREVDVSDERIQEIITSTQTSYQERAQTIILDNLGRKLEASLRDYYEEHSKALRVDVQAVLNGTSDLSSTIQDQIHRAIRVNLDAETIQTHIDQTLTLSQEIKQEKLNRLTSEVREYVSAMEFKAMLDPTYTMPQNLLDEISKWESDKNNEALSLGALEINILRARRNLEIYDVPDDEVQRAILNGQTAGTNPSDS